MAGSVAYMTPAAFKAATAMPAADVDALELMEPGHVATRLLFNSAWIDDRLRKRYAAPFDAGTPPTTVLAWLVSLTTWDLYKKRGYHPGAAQDEEIKLEAVTAKAEILEAADAKDGKFDLPLRADASETGITKAEPMVDAQPSPYEWIDRQSDAIASRGYP